MLPEPEPALVPVLPLVPVVPVSPVAPAPVSVLPAVVPASLAVAGVVSSPVVLHAASKAADAINPAIFQDLVMLGFSWIY
jgi:hypothetical protein